MNRVEEMTVVRVSVPQAMRILTTYSRFSEWVAPDISVTPHTLSPTLSAGDRFRMEVLGTVRFDYLVEAVSEREVVFAFQGPWSGRERWSFVADGGDTIVRRVQEMDEQSRAGGAVWTTIGRALVMAHFKLELMRFREAAEREAGPRAEIEARTGGASSSPPSFPIDDG
jgi:hypothetical protein